MKRLFLLSLIVLAALFAPIKSNIPSAAAQGQPCQWNYAFVNGVATATYCGDTSFNGNSNITAGKSYEIGGRQVLGSNTTIPTGFASYMPYLLTGATTDWLQTYAYGDNGTPIVSLSKVGGVGVVGGARASDATSSHSSPVGMQGMGWVDGTGSNVNIGAWGGVSVCTVIPGSTGPCQGHEIEIVNLANSTATVTPYNMFPTGASNGNWIGSGGGCTNAAPCYNPVTGLTNLVARSASVAVGITTNVADFVEGIVVKADAIHGADGTDSSGAGIVIDMARGHEFVWRVTGGGIASTLGSFTTSTGPAKKLIFSDDGIDFQNGSGTTLFQHYIGTNSVNGFDFAANATGNAPTISPIGSDTNISVAVAPKGTGNLIVTGADGTVSTNVSSAPLTTYTSQTTSRTLACGMLDDYNGGCNVAGGGDLKFNVGGTNLLDLNTSGIYVNVYPLVAAKGIQNVLIHVAALPTCNSAAGGLEFAVDDANSTTFNATVAGGGSNVVKAFCNKTNWTIH